MCGIVGGIAERNLIPILLEGLKRLEYRGYDSSGVAVLDSENTIQRVRALGKIKSLESKIAEAEHPLSGQVGIAHTRWATHGVPAENNAHPHVCNNQVAVVHNGIIENYQSLKNIKSPKDIALHPILIRKLLRTPSIIVYNRKTNVIPGLIRNLPKHPLF